MWLWPWCTTTAPWQWCYIRHLTLLIHFGFASAHQAYSSHFKLQQSESQADLLILKIINMSGCSHWTWTLILSFGLAYAISLRHSTRWRSCGAMHCCQPLYHPIRSWPGWWILGPAVLQELPQNVWQCGWCVLPLQWPCTLNDAGEEHVILLEIIVGRFTRGNLADVHDIDTVH